MSADRKCTHCQKSKPTTEFYKRGRTWSSWCRECGKEWGRRQVASGYFRNLRRSRAAAEGRTPPRRLTAIQRLAADSHGNIVKRCKYAGLTTDITRRWVEEAFEAFARDNYCDARRGSPFRPSVDRIDGAGWYTVKNVRVVWLIENYARNRFTDEDVVRFCRLKLGLE